MQEISKPMLKYSDGELKALKEALRIEVEKIIRAIEIIEEKKIEGEQ